MTTEKQKKTISATTATDNSHGFGKSVTHTHQRENDSHTAGSKTHDVDDVCTENQHYTYTHTKRPLLFGPNFSVY